MATFDWRGRNNRGEVVQGQLEAMTEGGVADQLVAIGVAPVHIALAKVSTDAGAEGWFERLNRKPVVDEDLMIFSRQMYTLNKAGVPILRAFAGLLFHLIGRENSMAARLQPFGYGAFANLAHSQRLVETTHAAPQIRIAGMCLRRRQHLARNRGLLALAMGIQRLSLSGRET